MNFRVGLGQDSHKFLPPDSGKCCVLGGVIIPDALGLDADSDGDVVLHSLTNAISSLTHVNILGDIAPKMCKEQGITDSKEYLFKAIETLGKKKVSHIAFSIEGLKPRLKGHFHPIRRNVALLMNIDIDQVGMTCTTGNYLSDCARGLGLQCLCILTIQDVG